MGRELPCYPGKVGGEREVVSLAILHSNCGGSVRLVLPLGSRASALCLYAWHLCAFFIVMDTELSALVYADCVVEKRNDAFSKRVLVLLE